MYPAEVFDTCPMRYTSCYQVRTYVDASGEISIGYCSIKKRINSMKHDEMVNGQDVQLLQCPPKPA